MVTHEDHPEKIFLFEDSDCQTMSVIDRSVFNDDHNVSLETQVNEEMESLGMTCRPIRAILFLTSPKDSKDEDNDCEIEVRIVENWFWMTQYKNCIENMKKRMKMIDNLKKYGYKSSLGLEVSNREFQKIFGEEFIKRAIRRFDRGHQVYSFIAGNARRIMIGKRFNLNSMSKYVHDDIQLDHYVGFSKYGSLDEDGYGTMFRHEDMQFDSSVPKPLTDFEAIHIIQTLDRVNSYLDLNGAKIYVREEPSEDSMTKDETKTIKFYYIETRDGLFVCNSPYLCHEIFRIPNSELNFKDRIQFEEIPIEVQELIKYNEARDDLKRISFKIAIFKTRFEIDRIYKIAHYILGHVRMRQVIKIDRYINFITQGRSRLMNDIDYDMYREIYEDELNGSAKAIYYSVKTLLNHLNDIPITVALLHLKDEKTGEYIASSAILTPSG